MAKLSDNYDRRVAKAERKLMLAMTEMYTLWEHSQDTKLSEALSDIQASRDKLKNVVLFKDGK